MFILTWRNLAIAEARLNMLKLRCNYLDRRIADPQQAMYARIELKDRQIRIAELEKEIRRYKDLIYRRYFPEKQLADISLRQLPKDLIRRRISLNITQAELGQTLGFARQTIAKYEQTYYAAVSLKRMTQIDAALRMLEEKREEKEHV